MYTIKWDAWKQPNGCREFVEIRKQNLKHTTIVWIITGSEIDLEMDHCVYYKSSPILLWLN